MRDPLVSVIVPVYNVENYLCTCLDSIISQSYTNLEIIVVNDGSTDLSGDIARKYADRDKRIVLKNKENGGVTSARNAGLDLVSGKYFSFVDSDDFIQSDMIESMVSLAEKYKLDLVKCNYTRYINGEIQHVEESGNVEFFDAEGAMKNFIAAPYCERKSFKCTLCDALYLSEKMKKFRFPNGVIYEEGFYIPLVLMESNKLAHIDKTYYVYRHTANSIMDSGFTKKSLTAIDDWKFIYENVNVKMPHLSLMAANRWMLKLIRVYDLLQSNKEVDEDRYYQLYIRKVLEDNLDIFERAEDYKTNKNKIKIIIESPGKYDRYVLKEKYKRKIMLLLTKLKATLFNRI